MPWTLAIKINELHSGNLREIFFILEISSILETGPFDSLLCHATMSCHTAECIKLRRGTSVTRNSLPYLS